MECKFGTIQQIHQRLVSEGYFVSRYALRQWVKSGAFPSVQSGNKILIAYDQVLEFLTTGSVSAAL